MSELKKRHRGYSGQWVTHYAKCEDWEGYFCKTIKGKMFTDSKMDGTKWDEGYLFNINGYPDSIKIIEL